MWRGDMILSILDIHVDFLGITIVGRPAMAPKGVGPALAGR